MIRGAACLAICVLLTGCAAEADTDSATPEQTTGTIASAPPAHEGPGWTDRVWVGTDGEMPGRMRIFLSDGTLVMDSCWEVYRLSAWENVGENGIVWSEDGQEVRAEVLASGEDSLRLRLDLVDGSHEESYRPAEVPYVCPEMVR